VRIVRATLSLLALLVAQHRPLRAQDTTATRAAAGILIDFQDVDLRAVITALAEAGNLNVSYGDIPSRRVTLRLRQPIAKADVLPLLKSFAQANGLQVIQEERFLRLEPDAARAAGMVAGTTRRDTAQAVEARIYVHRLKHVRAAKLAATLQSIFGSTATASAPAPSGARTLSQQLTANQVPRAPSDSMKPAAPVAAPATPAGLPGVLHDKVLIVSDETTNALVIHAQPGDYEIVRQAIDALDLRPLQVLIEVLIAEVRHTSELDLGVSARSTLEPPNAASTGPTISSASTADLIIRLSKSATFDINVAVRALQTRGEVRILSRPVLLAQNNQEAKILVGSQRPFVQVFRSLPTDGAVRDQVVQYKDVGTSLTILPTINADGYVNLQVAQEVSTATTEVQFGAPIISTREASTHLFVRDGQTAVLGGLVDREQDRTRSGIPWLSALPFAGHFFGSTTESRSSSELFLFVTPHIVETDDELDRLRRQMEDRSPQVRDQLPRNPPLPAKPPRQ
jgi:general secretion pathway protein D